ncbi:uncharacterized protein LOC105387108 [Plutella xylostella]|uniref:uncharacterized protein LOC105387108 n=1 Tax=Plutella xylostella TaxID=51655 RepID=UPI00203226C4|nr:uncharacterized protein LOC105387108 [Plutella xylostella]
MIPNQNCEIFASILFFLLAKICCYFHIKTTTFMSKHHSRLTSIPERNEIEEEAQKKWVPKKKHEVLKAKYKCLKKLFQIYDASLLGYLPETEQSDHVDDEESNHRRKKRSYRTNTDAHVGTSEEINVDNIEPAELSDQSTVLTGKNHVNCGSSIDRSSDNSYRYQMTQVSNLNLQGCNCASNHQDMPKAPFKTGTKRPTRFQSFMQRAFGLRVEKICPHNCSSNIYAISDNIINYRSNSKRRRKGFRFRRIKCPKRVQSESAIHDFKSPAILNYMQSVQRNCLLDTTPRKCPITGCNVMLYGIINYNDHLNLCHFTERKYTCLYCHEGFERESDKLSHENEHIGFNKLNLHSSGKSTPTSNKTETKAIDSQTETDKSVLDEKVKKAVSFMEHDVSNSNASRNKLESVAKKSSSYFSMLRRKSSFNSIIGYKGSKDSATQDIGRASSCTSTFINKNFPSISQSEASRLIDCTTDPKTSTLTDRITDSCKSTSLHKCQICGLEFQHRRQLGSHVNSQHRNLIKTKKNNLVSETGKILIESVDDRPKSPALTTFITETDLAARKSRRVINDDEEPTNMGYTSASEAECKTLSDLKRGKSKGKLKWVRTASICA